nr:hypothetical protein [Tanacetum cinerariifolium]
MSTQQNINATRVQRLANTHDSLATKTDRGNQFRHNTVQNVGHLVGQNAVQNQGIQNVRNQNGLSVVPGIANQHGNGNVVAAWAKGNSNGINRNSIRDRCRFLKKKKHGFNSLLRNLISWLLQSDKAPVYDSDGSAKVHLSKNCYDNDIFNMFTQEEQYTKLVEPILETHQVQQNDSNVISAVSSMEQGRGTVEQHSKNVEETRAYHESFFHNLAAEVEKVNLVNRKFRETYADLTTELARYKNQEKCFEISQEKYDKLERCYQKSIYQEQCLTKKTNAHHLSFGKQITTLNEEISTLNNYFLKEKSTISSILEEKKKLKSDFKIHEDEILDKQIQLENKIKELDNILVKTGQSIQTMHMLSPKPDLFYHTEHKMALGYQNTFYLKQAQQKQQSLYNDKVLLENHDPPVMYDSEETLQLAQESRLKMKQLNKEIKPTNYTKINHLSRVFVSQTAKSREELYFSNTSKMANVSKPISIPNEEFLDDTTPSVAQKFLNEQRVFDLETTKISQAQEITSLKKRVKRLVKKRRSRTHGLKRLYKVGLSARVESSADKESLGREDTSKQWRISDIYANQDIYLVNVQRDEDVFGVDDQDDTSMFDAEKDLQGEEVVVEEVNTASITTSAAATTTTTATTPSITMDEITLAKALIEIKTSRPKAKRIVMQEPSETPTPKLIVSSQ